MARWTQTLEERFWSKVDRRGPDDCWLWIGGSTNRGYGIFHVSRQSRRAHRISWEIAYGVIPDGLVVRHKVCNNTLCVNPRHLALGTQKENIQDKFIHKTCARGETHGLAKLTEESVRKIRKMYKSGSLTKREIARIFGVDPNAIQSVLNGKTWKHVQ